MARANTEAMMTSRTASNAVFSARERLLLRRTMMRVAQKTITPQRNLQECQFFWFHAETKQPFELL